MNTMYVQVPEYPQYFVSNSGEVVSVFGKEWKQLSSPPNTRGYPSVMLYNSTAVKRFNVHKLVAEAFIGPAPLGFVVNHVNGVKTDNRADNLEYVTYADNTKHAWETGLAKPKLGSKHHNAQDIKKLKAALELKGKMSQSKAADIVGLSQTVVSRLWRGVHSLQKEGLI